MANKFRSYKQFLEEGTLINSDLPENNRSYQKETAKKINGLFGITPLLPLSFSKEGPYNLIVDLKDVVKQNFKNLVLTEPGERIMDTNFGVGLMAYLFETKTATTEQEIVQRITSQVNRYMSFLNIDDIVFEDDEMEPNYLGVSIYYSIPSLAIKDALSVSIGE